LGLSTSQSARVPGQIGARSVTVALATILTCTLTQAFQPADWLSPHLYPFTLHSVTT
jgi:hypothetical protein